MTFVKSRKQFPTTIPALLHAQQPRKLRRFLRIPLLCCFVSLSGCDKPETTESAPAVPSPTIPPVLASTLTPMIKMPTPTEANHLAPPGVYFLLTATSVTTEDGITGLRPGTRVLKRPDGRYMAEGLTVELTADQITNDLRIASRVAGADQDAQAAIRKALQAAPHQTPLGISVNAVAQQTPTPTPPPIAENSGGIPPRDNPLNSKATKVNPDFDANGHPRYHSRIH